MHKSLIYPYIHFYLTCFCVSFSQSSEAGAHFRQWFKPPGYGVITCALTPYPVAPPETLVSYQRTRRHVTSLLLLNIYCHLNRKSWKFFHKFGYQHTRSHNPDVSNLEFNLMVLFVHKITRRRSLAVRFSITLTKTEVKPPFF
jgi:hypothetical protein